MSHTSLIGGRFLLGNHVEAGPGRLPVDLELLALLVGEAGDVAAGDGLDETGEQLLSPLGD